jgi:hypothetical protein
MKNGNQPAFAVEVSIDGNDTIKGAQTSNFSWYEIGLTKREYFAAKAMQGLLATMDSTQFPPTSYNTKYCAELAVTAADALLTALEQPQP